MSNSSATSWKDRVYLLLKISLSVGILLFLFSQIPSLETFLSLRHQTNWTFVALGYFTATVIIFIQAFRWRHAMLLSNQEKPSYHIFLYYIFVGHTTNMFLPSSVGGDLFKSIALGKKLKETGASVTSIFLCKILGLAVLSLFFGLSFLFDVQTDIDQRWYYLILLVFCSIFLFITVILFVKIDTVKHPLLAKLRIEKVFFHLNKYQGKFSRIFTTFLYTIAIQGCLILSQFLLYQSLNLPIEMGHVLQNIPLITIVTMLPIFLGGTGGREMMIVLLYTQIPGVTLEHCMFVSALSYMHALLIAFIGAILISIKLLRIRMKK